MAGRKCLLPLRYRVSYDKSRPVEPGESRDDIPSRKRSPSSRRSHETQRACQLVVDLSDAFCFLIKSSTNVASIDQTVSPRARDRAPSRAWRRCDSLLQSPVRRCHVACRLTCHCACGGFRHRHHGNDHPTPCCSFASPIQPPIESSFQTLSHRKRREQNGNIVVVT